MQGFCYKMHHNANEGCWRGFLCHSTSRATAMMLAVSRGSIAVDLWPPCCQPDGMAQVWVLQLLDPEQRYHRVCYSSKECAGSCLCLGCAILCCCGLLLGLALGLASSPWMLLQLLLIACSVLCTQPHGCTELQAFHRQKVELWGVSLIHTDSGSVLMRQSVWKPSNRSEQSIA